MDFMRKIKPVLTVAVLLILPWGGHATDRDSIAYIHTKGLTDAIESRHSRPAAFSGFVLGNPAVNGMYYSTNLTEIKIGTMQRGEDEAAVLENGDGAGLYSFHVDSYARLGKGNAAWGGASYISGKKKNVIWNSSSDYELIYPYVTADSVGGNLNTEQYAFYGGYYHRFGRITAGVDADFRVLHEYRSRNPRPRNISLDLDLTAAIACNITPKYLGAVSGNMRIYKQTTDVAHYSDNGDAGAEQFLLSGLGTYAPAFSNNNTADMQYEANSFGASFELLPLSGSGVFLRLGYDRFRLERISNNHKGFPVNELTRHASKAEIAYMRSGKFTWGVRGAAAYTYGEGTDNIPGESPRHDLPLLISLRMYERVQTEYSLRVITGYALERWSLVAEPYASYASSNETHIYPEHIMNVAGFGAGLTLTATYKTPKWRLEGILDGTHHINTGAELSMPVGNMKSSLVEMMNYRFGRLTDDYTLLSAAVRADLATNRKGMGIFAQLRWEYVMYNYNGGTNGNTLNANIGITF